MNLGSHTPAQILKLLPELDAQHKRAQAEVMIAEENLHGARARVAEAGQTLAEALARFLRGFPDEVVAYAVEGRTRPTSPPDPPAPAPSHAGDNGTSMVAEIE